MARSLRGILAALVMSVLMALSMTAFALADGEPAAEPAGDTTPAASQNLSIANAKSGSEYSVYQVMTATYAGRSDSGEALYTYTVSDAFKGFFEGGANGYTLNEQNEIMKKNDDNTVGGDARWTNTNSSDAAALATALSRYAITNNIGTAAVITGTDAVSLPIGYYVVAETKSAEDASGDDSAAREVATKPILVNLVNDAADITLKDDTTDLEKKIVETDADGNSIYVDQNDVNIGDSVAFRITTNIPTYEANVDKTKLMFKLTDEFSTGLTYNDDLAIQGFTSGTDYTATINGQILTIEFTRDAIVANQGAPVVATYSATLNENAVVDSTAGNPNDVKLEYTNNTNEEESHKTLTDETKTFTYGFGLHKVDKAKATNANVFTEGLANAKFQLKDSSGNVIHFTKVGDTYKVDENGDVTEIVSTAAGNETAVAKIVGLDAGTYTLTETQAPDQYTKLASDIIVTITAAKDANGAETGNATLTTGGAGGATPEVINANNGRSTGDVTTSGDGTININVYVENAKGISLPETGAMSSLYCMIGGGAVVLAGIAYYVFVARRKKA